MIKDILIDYVEKNKLLEKELISLQKHENNLNNQLKMIKRAKAFQFWQSINKIKKSISFSLANKRNVLPSFRNIHQAGKSTLKKEKIAIFTERLLFGFGVDLVVDQQASLLSKKYNVTVFSISIDPEFIKNKPYNVVQLFIPLAFNPIKQDFNSVKFYLKNNKLFSNYSRFFIHTPTFNSWLPFLKRNGQTHVFYHGNSPSFFYQGFKKYRKSILDLLENLIYFNFADNIVSISYSLKKFLWKKHQQKTVVVYHGSNHITDKLKEISIREQTKILNKFGIKSTDKLVTYIGRLDYHNNPYKNTKLLFKLAKELGNKKYKIIAIGFPENNIQEEMYMAGVYSIANASDEELVSILNRSTVHVSPSLWEGFNLPLIEAQALGVPVVAFNIGAHPEVVNNGKSGFLVKNEEEFFNKIKLLSDTKLRKEFSNEAIKFSSEFTWKKNFKNIDELI